MPGDPTHIINGGMGGEFYTAHFDPATEKLTNLSARPYSVGGSWCVAGQAESDGSILHTGWLGFGNAPGVPIPTNAFCVSLSLYLAASLALSYYRVHRHRLTWSST